MTKDTQGKKSKGRSSNKIAAEPAPPPPSAPTWGRRAKDSARSILGTAVYGAIAHYVKHGIIWVVSSVASVAVPVAAAYYFGIDIRDWLPKKGAPMETGSISKQPAPVDPEALKREIECNVRKIREVDALTSRRKTSWAEYKRCEADWKPSEKQTIEVVCGPKLKEHKDLAQAVRDREARECSPTAAVK